MKSILNQFLLLVLFSISINAQVVDSTTTSETDTVLQSKGFFQVIQYGNVHGFGIEFNYRLKNIVYLNSSIGVMLPIVIVLDPPFPSNRFNITSGIKYQIHSWVYLDVGIYLGLYKLTEIMWIIRPKLGVGIVFDKFVFEIGSVFNMPSKIYTSSDIDGGNIGYGEERIGSPTFLFFKLGYKVSL